MTRLLRLASLTALALTLSAGVSHAAPINVAIFSWDVFTDLTVPDDPFTVSFFSLTNIWDGPGAVDLFDSSLTLPTGTQPQDHLEFPGTFEQAAIVGVPGFASTSVSFVFEGQKYTLDATLSNPDTLAVLQFDPTTVPEPGTLGLLAVGSGLFTLRTRRRRRPN